MKIEIKVKTLIIFYIIFIIVIAVVFAIGRTTADTDTSPEVDRLRNTITEYQRLYNDARKELAELSAENREVTEQLRNAERTVEILETRVEEFERRIAELQERYSEVEKLIEEGTGNIGELDEENRAAIGYVRQIRAEYRRAKEIIDKLREKN